MNINSGVPSFVVQKNWHHLCDKKSKPLNWPTHRIATSIAMRCVSCCNVLDFIFNYCCPVKRHVSRKYYLLRYLSLCFLQFAVGLYWLSLFRIYFDFISSSYCELFLSRFAFGIRRKQWTIVENLEGEYAKKSRKRTER